MYQVCVRVGDNVCRDIPGEHLPAQVLQLHGGVFYCAGEILSHAHTRTHTHTNTHKHTHREEREETFTDLIKSRRSADSSVLYLPL